MSFNAWKKRKSSVQFQEEDTVDNRYFIGYTSEPPALQHIAAVSIASRLWSESDIKEDVKQHSESSVFDSKTRLAREAYEEFEERVFEKLDRMPLPNKLKCKVSDIFYPIGLQLFKGFSKEIEYFSCFGQSMKNKDKDYCRFYDIFKVGGSVYWTMEGVIDNVTSLKGLINNGDQEKDFNSLYDLACKYCLEEYIPDIWKNISSNKKNDIVRSYENYESHIVAYWTASIENKLFSLLEKLRKRDVDNIYDNKLSIVKNMISLSIHVKNPFSLRYFWKKMNEQESIITSGNLERWLNQAIQKFKWDRYEYQNCNDKTNILCFLLTHLKNENQQKEAFQAHSKIILKALLFDWRWQKFFYPTFSIMLDYISEEVFIEIMYLVAEKIKSNRTIIETFKEIWFKSSLNLKESLIQHLNSSSILYHFIDNDYIETIFLIFKYTTAEAIKKILFNMIGNFRFFEIMYSEKLGIIDTLITKYFTSSREINNFKHRVMSECANVLCRKWIGESNFQAVEILLAWGFKSPEEIRKFKENVKIEIYRSLVCEGDYEVVDKFLSWYFESQEEIAKFKRDFFYETNEDNVPIYIDILLELSIGEQGLELFEKFTNYNSCSPEEVIKFKNKYLESVEIVESLLDTQQFNFADKFLNWCLGSEEECNRFKNSFVTSERGIGYVLKITNRYRNFWYNTIAVLNWLSISNESTEVLKCKLNNSEFLSHSDMAAMDYERFAIIYLLDKYVNIEYMEDSNISYNSDITREIMEAYRNK